MQFCFINLSVCVYEAIYRAPIKQLIELLVTSVEPVSSALNIN